MEDDEGPRADTTMEGLAKLRPAFDTKGTVTAGNTSQVSDGAAACVLMSTGQGRGAGAQAHGALPPLHRGGRPARDHGHRPDPGDPQADGGLRAEARRHRHLVEINEAFAAQAAYCVRELGMDPKRVNPNGGAIALGHPLGAHRRRPHGQAAPRDGSARTTSTAW